MNGVIYARFSCDHQREESIEGQIRECREYADHNGINIIEIYADRALTGKTDKRPRFQKMIRDSERKLFDVVLVWKLDRFSRNRYDSAIYKNKLKKNGIRVISAKEQISDSPEGIILESMLEGMAEYYSADLSVKISRGLKENALKCKYNGGTIPLGYMKGEDQHLVTNPATAPLVEEIFTRYAKGDTIREIIKSLNERGIKTTRGNEFRQSSLDSLLCNHVYLGYYKGMGEEIKGGIPQLISKELFDKVQQRRKKNRRAPSAYKATEEYLLTTKLFCGRCGSMMAGENGRSKTGAKYYYYKCGNHKRAEGCHQRTLRKEVAEKLVIDRAIEIIRQEDLIDYVAECATRIQNQESSILPVLNEQLKETSKGIENIVNAIQMGIFTASTKERLESLEAEKKKIETAIQAEKLEHPEIPKEYFADWLGRLRLGDAANPTYRKMIADVFLNSVYLTDEGLIFGLNFIDGVETIPLREWSQAKSSDLLGCAPPNQNGVVGHDDPAFFFPDDFCGFLPLLKEEWSWNIPLSRLAMARRFLTPKCLQTAAYWCIFARILFIVLSLSSPRRNGARSPGLRQTNSRSSKGSS